MFSVWKIFVHDLVIFTYFLFLENNAVQSISLFSDYIFA